MRALMLITALTLTACGSDEGDTSTPRATACPDTTFGNRAVTTRDDFSFNDRDIPASPSTPPCDKP